MHTRLIGTTIQYDVGWHHLQQKTHPPFAEAGINGSNHFYYYFNSVFLIQ